MVAALRSTSVSPFDHQERADGTGGEAPFRVPGPIPLTPLPRRQIGLGGLPGNRLVAAGAFVTLIALPTWLAFANRSQPATSTGNGVPPPVGPVASGTEVEGSSPGGDDQGSDDGPGDRGTGIDPADRDDERAFGYRPSTSEGRSPTIRVTTSATTGSSTGPVPTSGTTSTSSPATSSPAASSPATTSTVPASTATRRDRTTTSRERTTTTDRAPTTTTVRERTTTSRERTTSTPATTTRPPSRAAAPSTSTVTVIPPTAAPLRRATTTRQQTSRPPATPPAEALPSGNLLRGGGFESPRIPDGEHGFVTPSGWRSSAGVIELWASGHDGVGSHRGRQHTELNGHGPVEISQTVELVGGATYRWSLVHRGRRDDDSIEILVDGRVIARVTSSPGSWRRAGDEFDVPSGRDRIVFAVRAVDSGSVGNLVDDIELVAVSRLP